MNTFAKNRGWVNPISISVLLIPAALLILLCQFHIISPAVLLGGLLFFILLSASIRVADQWERAVVLRMGKFQGLKGPGPFLIIPIIDQVATYIDQRVRVSAFKAEQTLTKDTVPVNGMPSFTGPCGMWKRQRSKYRNTRRPSSTLPRQACATPSANTSWPPSCKNATR